MKRVIVPFFISHQGCPHRCLFCDQKTLNGSSGRLPMPSEIVDTVRRYRHSSHLSQVSVAFYGGTFTSLPQETQRVLLAAVQPLIESGEVGGIRISTRPDAVDDGTAGFLASRGVTLVELGAQSFDDLVLDRTERGYGQRDIVGAVDVLRRHGLKVGIQLMPGLPGDTPERSLGSFESALALRPDCLRLYPTVVLKGTRLAELYYAGAYRPLSLDEAVSRCKEMLHRALQTGVPVIRMGIHPGNDLQEGAAIVAGPYHPAFRHLVESELCFDLICRVVGEPSPHDRMVVTCSPRLVSAVIGQRRANIVRLERRYGVRVAEVRQAQELEQYDIRIETPGQDRRGNVLKDLCYAGKRVYRV